MLWYINKDHRWSMIIMARYCGTVILLLRVDRKASSGCGWGKGVIRNSAFTCTDSNHDSSNYNDFNCLIYKKKWNSQNVKIWLDITLYPVHLTLCSGQFFIACVQRCISAGVRKYSAYAVSYVFTSLHRVRSIGYIMLHKFYIISY